LASSSRRRKLWIILTAVAFAIITMIIVRHIPDFYRSETVIMVDPQTVSSSVVQSPVTSTIQDRLSTIEQQVMSPSRLERVIETQNLYPGLRTKVSDQDLVAKMQRATKIDVVNAGGRGLSKNSSPAPPTF